MKAPRMRVIVAVVVGVPTVLAAAWLIRDWLERANKPVLPPPPPMHEPRLVVEPEKVDLGRRSQCDGLIRIRGSIRNDSSEPAILEDWVTSCGCTMPFGSLRREMKIAPGERYDFEITSDAWGVSGPKTYTVDFMERRATRPVKFTLSYIVESPIYTTTGFHIRGFEETSASLVVKSRDQQPFRILSADPPVIEVDPERNAAEHALTIDWTKADKVFGPGWLEGELRLHTDRESCPVLHYRVMGQGSMPEAESPKPSSVTPPAAPVATPAPSGAAAAPR